VGALSGRSPRLGKDGRIRHVEYVKEFMDEPDYARLIEAAKRNRWPWRPPGGGGEGR